MTMGISEGTTTTRREEIVNACEKLYRTMSFREITLKEISEETSFSRPSIYNYFATKEEIFLALFEREYDRWNASLEEIHRGRRVLSSHAFAEKVPKSLSARPQLLKLRTGTCTTWRPTAAWNALRASSTHTVRQWRT